ncbi:9093_t:CDS:10 [Dentiscutata heterogama]|uniref:9093_t:CDS:1 n=1 Tax=Dentiscutata heterogama TaxID=1316150 RepID=A0ACA9L391_9GLOM|nr:9093_t:CDS:10 [Dentiscutata heterogama]
MEKSNKSLGGQDQAKKRSTQHATLAKEFMDTMTSYRNMQIENARKYRKKITEQYLKVNPDATQEEIDQFIDNDINKSSTIITEIQDRQRDVRRIENSINELKNKFNEIQALVIEKDDTVHTTRFFELTQDSPQTERIVRQPKISHTNKNRRLYVPDVPVNNNLHQKLSLKKLGKKDNDALCLYPGCPNKVKRGRNGIDFNYCSTACQLASFQSINPEPVNGYEVAPEVYDVDATETQQWSQPQTNPVILESSSQPSQNSNDTNKFSRNPFGLLQQSSSSSSYFPTSQQEYTPTNDYYASSKQSEPNFSTWLDPNVNPDNLSFSPFEQTSNDSAEAKTVFCSNCTYFVRPNRTTCEICGTNVKKEKSVQNELSDYWIKKAEEEEDDLYIDVLTNHTPDDDKNHIICQSCMFLNHPLLSYCEICESQLITDAAIRCSACSFLNNPIHSQCEMCYSPIGDLEFLNVPDLNMQQCPVCTLYNQDNMTTCEACGSFLKQLTPILNTIMTVLEQTSNQYREIHRRFAATMPNVQVVAIIGLQMPTRLVEAHERYKNDMARGSRVTPESITHKMFHGTKCICNNPTNYAQWNHCRNNGCGACGIARNGNSSTFGRCGGGRMWFAQQSNISYNYCTPGATIKTMYTVDVVSLAPPTASVLIVNRNEASIIVI